MKINHYFRVAATDAVILAFFSFDTETNGLQSTIITGTPTSIGIRRNFQDHLISLSRWQSAKKITAEEFATAYAKAVALDIEQEIKPYSFDETAQQLKMAL